jgi:RimJ/RimL family protein N-acetyltransferase
MITLAHGHIRTADADDIYAFHALYQIHKPRAALLDKAREPLLPTRDELSVMLSKKDTFKGGLYVLDDTEGEVRGFCTLRGMVQDARYAEMGIFLYEDTDYISPLAVDALEFIRSEAFERYQLYKVITQALDSETAWVSFLGEHAFEQSGQQRNVLYAGGKWHNLLTFSLYHPQGEKVFADSSVPGIHL